MENYTTPSQETLKKEIELYQRLLSISSQIATLSQCLWDYEDQNTLEELKKERVKLIDQFKTLYNEPKLERENPMYDY